MYSHSRWSGETELCEAIQIASDVVEGRRPKNWSLQCGSDPRQSCMRRLAISKTLGSQELLL